MSPLDALSDADLEQLSQHLDGELSSKQADRLKLRLSHEPALAEAWRCMSALPAALAELPAAVAVPPALIQQVVAARRPQKAGANRRWVPGNIVLGLVLGAASTLLLLRPKPEARLDLLAGEQVVEGQAVLMAGGTRIAVDGRARIAVEPGAGAARASHASPNAEEPMHPSSLVAGALGGALITVAVYEGSATLEPPGGPTQQLSAGQQAQVGGPGADPQRPSPPDAPRPPRQAAAAPADLPAALARIDALQQEIAALELERDMQAGALVQAEGQPQPWPEGLHPAYAEPGFTRSIQGALAADPELELMGVDCAEYPCIALVRSFGEEGGDGPKTLGERLGQQLAGQGLAEPGLGLWVSREQGPEGTDPLTLVAVAVSDPERAADYSHTRTDWRIGEWTAQIVDELAAGPAPGPYPER